MREGRASLTAEYVAFARAVANLEGGPLHIDEPFARATLRPHLRELVDLAAAPRVGALTRLVLRAGSCGLIDHLAYRTQAIDDAIDHAVAIASSDTTRAASKRAMQCVILGAGLDTRAYRLRSLSDIDVYEVDHPASQALKRRLTEELHLEHPRHHYVALDFARDDLFDALEAAGHRSDVPTVWIWEGVTMYLTREAFVSTLHRMGLRSAVGSTLAVTYFRNAQSPLRRTVQRALRAPLTAIGEPVVGGMESAMFAEDLRRHGFEIVTDENDRDWSQERGLRMHPLDVFVGERLAIAVRSKNG